jgi:ElaB/YqjD/DUF883 family membrane-anchored ribosome-binding protein
LSAEIETTCERAADPDQRCRDLLLGSSGRSRLPKHKGSIMATANRSLEEEFDALKAALEALRKDISSRFNSFGDATADELMTRGRRAGAAVGRAASDLWDDASNEASRRGRKGAVALGHRIEERPFVSVVIAFGIGLVIGGLISR